MRFRLFLLSILCFVVCLPRIAVEQEKDKQPLPEREGASQAKIKKILEIGRRPTTLSGKTEQNTSPGTFNIESGSISFSEVVPGHDKDLPASIAIRVFSQGNWRLRVSTYSLQVLDHTEKVPTSRLQIRSRSTSGFLPFENGRPILISRGTKTNPAGSLVLADLRLRLEDQDPVGTYSTQLQIILEVD